MLPEGNSKKLFQTVTKTGQSLPQLSEFGVPRKPPSAHIWRKDSRRPLSDLSVIMSVRRRSAGATMVRDTAPATPPAISLCKGCFGGVMHNLQAWEQAWGSLMNISIACHMGMHGRPPQQCCMVCKTCALLCRKPREKGQSKAQSSMIVLANWPWMKNCLSVAHGQCTMPLAKQDE